MADEPTQAQPASGGLTDEQRMAWAVWRIRDLEQQLAVALAAQSNATGRQYTVDPSTKETL